MDTIPIVYICADVVIGLVSVVVNSSVLYETCKTRHNDFTRKTLVMNMVAADFMVGLFVVPASAMVYAGLPGYYWGCYAATCAILGVMYISVLTRTALAMERFLAICKPLLHKTAYTFAKSLSLSLFLWPMGLLMAFIPMYFWGNIPRDLDQCTFFPAKPYMVYFQITVMLLVPFSLMSCAYVYCLCIIHKYRKRARSGLAYAMFVIDKSVQDTLERDLKIAMIVPGLLILLFFMFWLPFNILFSLPIFCEECDSNKEGVMAALMWSQTNSLTYPCLTFVIRRNTNVYGHVKDHLEQMIQMSDMSTVLKALPTDQMVTAASDALTDTTEGLKQNCTQLPETVVSEFVETAMASNPFQDQVMTKL